MSIVSKFLIVLIVVVSIAGSVMISVYAYVQPNWKDQAERNREQAEAASAASLGATTNQVATLPLSQMEMGVRDAEIRRLTKEKDERDREIKTLKDSLALAQTQFSTFQEPLARLEQESKKYQELLGKSQDEIRRLNVQTAQLVAEKTAAEKIANVKEVERATLKRQVQVLQSQNKSQEDRIQTLERGALRLEKEREEMAVVVQQARSQIGNQANSLGGGAGSEGVAGIPGGGGDALGQLLTTTGRSAVVKLAEAPHIRGKITEIKEISGVLYASINIGEDDNVRLNQTLHVFSADPPKYLGRLTITRLDYQTAAGRLEAIPGTKIDPAKAASAEVTADLKSLR